MANTRQRAIDVLMHRAPIAVDQVKDRTTLFGANVFGRQAMLNYLSKTAFKSIQAAIESGSKIDRRTADEVASGIKLWALARGATHYTHWFQPLTGSTAEKHDAFFEVTPTGSVLEKFDGAQLVQQEPDASSFPHGGLRNTFEARGYTAWDPTSPAFVYGNTLCIPTIFVSFTGEALDNKTPLLRALHALDHAATEVVHYFDKSVAKVNATLGWEQEFFLLDKGLATARPDIMLTGRTLMGHASAKGQQLDDHYFGSISNRALQFLIDLEQESLKLGIPLKTRHNEVAPNQFEIAPVFEEANLAVDHNALLMDVMQKIAEKHAFKVLFHEKPFAGVNGSGKHNNWSLQTDSGENLLQPGKTPKKNLQFLTFFINTIKAVHRYESLLRAAVASAGNDHRLGANEAPPAIISVFIGTQLTKVLDELEKVTDGKLSPAEKTELKLNVVGKIPEILLDNTDRNRTSPFAFTGNKFEFRAVGSSANCANPMTVLNAIVAEQLKAFVIEVDAYIDKGMKKDDAIFNVLREYIKDSKAIRFDGDGYGVEWVKMAKQRKLSHNKDAISALKERISTKTKSLFESLNVFKASEIEARYEIELEEYIKRVQIESRVLGDLSRNHIIPIAIKYQSILLDNVKGLKEIYGESFKELAHEQLLLIKSISDLITNVNAGVTAMTEARKKANKMPLEIRAHTYCAKVLPFLSSIRKDVDTIETLVDDELWTLPKNRELLFLM